MPVGPPLARRTTLAIAAGMVVLSGCDDRTEHPGPGLAPTAPSDPDVELVDGVLAELEHARRVASSAGDADLVALHEAHLEALEGAPGPVPAPGRYAAADVQRRERRLHHHLVEAAAAAQSGALAALLASMSAAVAQRSAAR